MMSMDMAGDLGWLGMGSMWLGALVPLALVVGVGWLLARGTGGRDVAPRGDDAATILRRRLAAGEIGVEQYEEARAALGLAEWRWERSGRMSVAPLPDRPTHPAPRQQRGAPVPGTYAPPPRRSGGAIGPIAGPGSRAR